MTENVPEAARLQHLKDALLGEARAIVSHIIPFAGCYKQAMDLLAERYENTRAIVNEQLHKLYSIPCIDVPSATALRNMLNTMNGVMAALKSCEIGTNTWDAILVYHLTQRFDKTTLSFWEDKLQGDRSVPKLQSLVRFLEARLTVHYNTESFSNVVPSKHISKPPFHQRSSFDHKKPPFDKPRAFFTLKPEYKCALCTANHLPSRCTTLYSKPVRERQILIARKNLCANCLYPHHVKECPFESACKKCTENHHTLLHSNDNQVFLNQVTDIEQDIGPQSSTDEQHEINDADEILSQLSTQHFFHLSDDGIEDTLLATALVPIRSNGRSMLSKALIDQGSTTNLITVRACSLLDLRYKRLHAPMYGVGNTPVGTVIGLTSFTIGSIHDNTYSLNVRAIVVKTIGDVKATNKECLREWSHLREVKLADPTYHEAHKIDSLLGNL